MSDRREYATGLVVIVAIFLLGFMLGSRWGALRARAEFYNVQTDGIRYE